MQRNTTYFRLIKYALLPAMLLASCSKGFLELTPKGRLIAKTTAEYQTLLANFDLEVLNTADPMAQMGMGDELAAASQYFNVSELRTQRVFGWENDLYDPAEDAGEITAPMSNIYLYTKVVNEVMQSEGGTEEAKKSVQAQAKTGRAWMYFLMINYFGKPYVATTAATDPGFPIVPAADATITDFTRASVQEVYDFIVKDLTDALPHLPDQITNRHRLSKAAGAAILGKVYMFMGRFGEALPHLNTAVAGFAASAFPVTLYDYNVTFAPGGVFLPIGPTGPTYPAANLNPENAFIKQTLNNWNLTSNDILISPETMALFGASDLRLKFYSKTPYPTGAAFPAGIHRRTGPGLIQQGVIVPDVILLQAECKARLNDLAGAQAAVETLRKKRMPAAGAAVPAAVAGNQQALVKYILEERIREFAGQGFRWFDMRRLSVDPVYKSTVGYTHKVYGPAGEVTASYTLRPERFVLRFTQKLMDQNPGMENNP
ncbi:RagB/SusD family nutrient uptake outer membrane protein [Chitinophaga lutea]|uniref:RagB/SusD family nutrient uptake outer membrane protein n=1 Tax=Chitinophaga lutea TaxID=2488634 RepID=A0A3N4PHH1_9BACT|nr:RagB/SusD family nutrient uptake outer membrane protein [Chitinophaga lutea]RPE08143.1 RagB/SusD family nutrient uptake outer membrane protein [Chitinophaga lutea]